MNRLVVMAIGGSGERVMASFIMALTSGMTVNAASVLPIFIDNDSESHSLKECKNLIKYYRQQRTASQNEIGANAIYEPALGHDNDKWPSFFKTEIEEPIYLDSDGGNIGNLNMVIGNLTDEQSNIIEERDLLFTDKDLQMPLDGGFIGNPNIGSVVLNAIALHDDRYESKHVEIDNMDGVVIIGSLFGGTGAAGIPLIVNKFKSKGNQCPKIGVVSLLPYFTTANTQQYASGSDYDVISDMFDVKTRAALMYYDDYMQEVDVQYYVGDSGCKAVYAHHIYGDSQNNATHPIEVMAALCAIDFSKVDFRDKVIYKRPVWSFSDDDTQDTLSSNLSDIPNSDLRKAFARFQMMKWLFTESDLLQDDIKENRRFVHNIGFNESMRESVVTRDEQKLRQFPYAWGLNYLFRAWDEWTRNLTNPNNRVPSKRKMSFVKSGAVNEDMLTQMFYTDHEHGWGIANVKQVGRWPRQPHPEPVPSEIKDALIDAYDTLVKQKVLPGSDTTVEDYKKLPYLLLIISKALDSIIGNKCNI
ncbi:MAG: hypothetical protein II859_00775 [Bacteroidales bacterium]|nr:hypothetical protein [Bacteroidales bacterium]